MAIVDQTNDGTVYLLDMGRLMYGDCILAIYGNTTILIDGGHSSDYNGQSGYQSIPEQLTEILGEPPFKVSLLVVTHCHADHIGCLPDMVESGLLQPTTAIVADEYFGFGRDFGAIDSVNDSIPAELRAIVAALREEDRSTMTDEELADFLLDAEKLEPRYLRMLSTLQERGTRLFRFGRDDTSAIESEFQSIGFEILGPTVEHLLICAETIAQQTRDAIQTVDSMVRTDAAATSMEMYRRIVDTKSIDNLDRPGKGAALNDQSIVIKLGSGLKTILLAGDMQFAKAEVGGLNEHMAGLREKVAAKAPYRFAKLSHHTSYNGVDQSVLDDFGNPPLLAHTGGENDSGHPDHDALQLLKSKSRTIKFARTDRNGLITLNVDTGFEIAKGRLNDFTPNGAGDVPVPFDPPANAPELPAREQHEPEILAGSEATIEVLYMRLPYRNGRVTIGNIPITVEVGSGGDGWKKPPLGQQAKIGLNERLPQSRDLRLANGRNLPKLLFITSSAKLKYNVGEREAGLALRMIKESGQELLDVSDPSTARNGTRNRLFQGGVEGVVIIGGYDVIPADRTDVLDARLRQQIGAEVSDEPDRFIVWSDDIYGDVDNDGIAELPVSRIPDGRSSELLLKCLSTKPESAPGRFGIRNQERPFANSIWSSIPGNNAILISGPFQTSHVQSSDMQRPCVYFMLHGDDDDCSRFWGEDGGVVEAINVSKVPISGIGTVFAGCCWGALTASQIASKAHGTLGMKTPEQSMALTLLKGGAKAFIGCTGAHYSPNDGGNYFGGPMHRAFWAELVGNRREPAAALFEARKSFLAGIPHGMTKPYHIGIERKIYKQFTCLGLGW